MAPRKRRAVSFPDHVSKKRKTEGSFSGKPNTIKELNRRQELLSASPTAAQKDLTRRNRNVASSRAVKKLKESDEYKAMSPDQQKEAEQNEKARVRAE